MFCLFSTVGPSLHPFRGRSRIYTGSPRVGKAPAETASHGRQQPPLVVNQIKGEWLQRAGRCSSKPSWSSRTEAVSSSRILQNRICFSSRLLCPRGTHLWPSGWHPPAPTFLCWNSISLHGFSVHIDIVHLTLFNFASVTHYCLSKPPQKNIFLTLFIIFI